ncbi:MAG: hypothetical protein FWC88_05060, partial [Endomicrobia bacterium]|nr:hypothetical protein [Endomicrobiia bacterium]
EKDILNNPSGIFAKEENVYLLNWWKKIIGHDVGVWVYTGFKAADKMSINWWIDRKVELDVIKNKYPHHHEEWKKMEALIDEVISSQKEKMRQELKKGNWQWAILDAIMYLNYQSTEWNALDWVYHKDWGSVTGDGFLAQRNKELVGETIYETNEKYKHLSGFVSKTIIEALTKNPGISLAELASILKEKNSIPEDNALTKLFNEFCSDNNSLNLIVGRLAGDKEHNYENGRLLNNSNYLSDYKIRALGEFYKNNFALHVKDMFGFSYMHSLLPVNDDGVVSIGTRGGGLRYKGEYYPPEKILEGLEKISLDIRNFQLGQDNISQIMEALNLITSIYSDVSTKIKPKDIAFQKKTGFGKIFNPLKILLLFAGHNPFDKLKKEKIGTTESDDNNMIRLINADHGISPKYGNMGSLFVVDPAKGVYSYGFEDSVSETIIEKNMVSKDSLDALLRISAEYNLFDFLRSRFGFFKIELEKTIRKAEKRRQQKTLKNNVFLFVPSLEKTLSSENFSENFMDADDLTRKKGKSFVIAFEDRITKDILPSQSRLIQKTTMDINGELETADIMLNSYGKTNVILIKTDKILDSRLKKQFLLNAVLPIINEDSALKDIVNKKGKRVFVKLEEDISSGEISFDESKLFGMSFVIPAEYASAAVKKVYDASAYGFIKGFAGSVFVEFTRAAKPDVENILRKQVPATIHSADILRAA